MKECRSNGKASNGESSRRCKRRNDASNKNVSLT
jgi:hypothetical protein